jgi:hypothetical protein
MSTNQSSMELIANHMSRMNALFMEQKMRHKREAMT